LIFRVTYFVESDKNGLHKVEDTFKEADAYIEEDIEPDLQDDSGVTDSDDDQDEEQ
jgi:hypothetical protein